MNILRDLLVKPEERRLAIEEIMLKVMIDQMLPTPQTDAAMKKRSAWCDEVESLRGDEPPRGWDFAKVQERRLIAAELILKRCEQSLSNVVDGSDNPTMKEAWTTWNEARLYLKSVDELPE